MRKSIDLNVKDTIIVFDESHNVENQAEDAFSYTLSEKDLVFTKKIKHTQKNWKLKRILSKLESI